MLELIFVCSFAVESYINVWSSTNKPCARLHAGHWEDSIEQGRHAPALLELSRYTPNSHVPKNHRPKNYNSTTTKKTNHEI